MKAKPKQIMGEDCRLLGHAWETYKPIHYRSMFRHVIHLRCVRCTTVRHDSFDTNGHLTQRKYDYPEDYKLPKEEVPSRDELRLRMMKRLRQVQKTKK